MSRRGAMVTRGAAGDGNLRGLEQASSSTTPLARYMKSREGKRSDAPRRTRARGACGGDSIELLDEREEEREEDARSHSSNPYSDEEEEQAGDGPPALEVNPDLVERGDREDVPPVAAPNNPQAMLAMLTNLVVSNTRTQNSTARALERMISQGSAGRRQVEVESEAAEIRRGARKRKTMACNNMPVYKEGDDLDIFFQAFETHMDVCEVPCEEWAAMLGSKLAGGPFGSISAVYG